MISDKVRGDRRWRHRRGWPELPNRLPGPFAEEGLSRSSEVNALVCGSMRRHTQRPTTIRVSPERHADEDPASNPKWSEKKLKRLGGLAHGGPSTVQELAGPSRQGRGG